MNANDQARIAGATACLETLLRRELCRPTPRLTFEEDRAKRDLALATLLATAGELSPRAVGAMSLLAELVIEEMDLSSIPDLEGWKAEATMTSDEIAKHRAEVKAEHWSEDDPEPKCCVISMTEWRATA